jgi:hypothetical protein
VDYQFAKKETTITETKWKQSALKIINAQATEIKPNTRGNLNRKFDVNNLVH